MTLYQDETAVRDYATEVATKATRKSARKWYALTAVGVVLAGGGAAYAAMLIKGDGTASATAGAATDLKITDGKFSGPLFPGGKIDLIATVENKNPIQVTLKTIALNGAATVTCGAPADKNLITGPIAGSATSYTLPAADQLVIPANSVRTLTVHNAVQLGAAATQGCALTIPFTITGDGAGV
jgi:hypothetical protein